MRRNTKGVTADALLRGGPGGTRWGPRRTLTPPDRYIFVAERRLVHRWFQPLHLSSEKNRFQMCLSHSTCAATARSPGINFWIPGMEGHDDEMATLAPYFNQTFKLPLRGAKLGPFIQ
jgi:hypothetical protein